MEWFRFWKREPQQDAALPSEQVCRRPDSEDLFDSVSRVMASAMPRRDAIKAAVIGIAGAVLLSAGIKPAWAATDCRCNGTPLPQGQACCNTSSPPRAYDPTTQCCTPSGVQNKYPIPSADACPNRVTHPGYVIPPPNGCGGAGSSIKPPDFPMGANFLACCNTHDNCYGTCNSNKATCDSTFLSCMRAACLTKFPSIFQLPLRNLCYDFANTYYLAVALGGGSFYNQGQIDACDCCAGDQPCCPSGRVMCEGTCCDAGQTCVNGQCRGGTCNPGTCGTFQNFNCGGDCYCFPVAEGGGVCSANYSCGSATPCSSSAQCGAGSVCTVNTCCGSQGYCTPRCSGSIRLPLGDGPNAAGL